MNHATPNRLVVLVAGAAVVIAVALAFTTTALGTGTSDGVEIAKLKRQVAALQVEVKSHPAMRSQLSVIAVASRVAFIDAAGIHAMETKYPTAGLTTRDVAAVQNVLALAAKIAWPEALQDDARELVGTCRAFLKAWNAGQKDEAFTQLKAAHGAYHALSASAWQWLG